jgi:Protein of unknown function (DUF732)
MRTIVIASALLILAGCSAPDAAEPSPVVTVTETAEAPEPEVIEEEEPVVEEVETSIDEEFVFDVESYYPNWSRFGGEDDLIELGQMTCDFFEEGGTLSMYMDNAEESDLPDDFATTMVAASLVNYCPELEDMVKSS